MKEEVYSSADAVNLEKLSGKVQFKNVVFSYGPDQPIVLNDISFEVLPATSWL